MSEQKMGREFGKEIWIVKRIKDNKIIKKFRTKILAEGLIRELDKLNIKSEYTLLRDNQWKFK